MSGIVIERLAEKHISGVMEISEAEFGHLYKKEGQFRADMEDPNVAVFVARDGDDVLGFSRCVLFGPEKVDEILKLPESKERDFLLGKKRIVLFDGMAIREGHQGKGIGTKLSKYAVPFRCDVVVAMAWKQYGSNHINADPLLTKSGFKRTELDIPGYWNLMVDEPEGHRCPICGAPDKCSAVLYYYDVRHSYLLYMGMKIRKRFRALTANHSSRFQKKDIRPA